MSYIIGFLFIYCVWYLLKPHKDILRTPLFGYSLDYYIFKECEPDERFYMEKYQNLPDQHSTSIIMLTFSSNKTIIN